MKSATLQLIELAEQLTASGEIGDGMVAQFHDLAARARNDWPETLDFKSPLAQILGTPNFACIGIANAYRAVGFEIPNKAEAEQAFFIHKAIGLWRDHGDNWRSAGQAELNAMRAEHDRVREAKSE